jgi:hypothetical protein
MIELIHMLYLVAILQVAIAVVNIGLDRLLGWEADLDRAPLLMREVFHVHSWFISFTLLIFAVLTWRFAPEFATGALPMASWLAGGIAAFWLFRMILQFAYYSSSHWRGRIGRTIIHVCCLLVYGGMGVVYLTAALGGVG